jgi:hypothetical protein
MAEERENYKPGNTAGGNTAGRNDDDVEAHTNHPALDDTDPELAKLKLANDEDDDVEGHSNHPSQTAG